MVSNWRLKKQFSNIYENKKKTSKNHSAFFTVYPSENDFSISTLKQEQKGIHSGQIQISYFNNNSQNLCSTYHVPGTVPSSYPHYLIVYYYYLNFTNEETEAEREVARPRSPPAQWQG